MLDVGRSVLAGGSWRAAGLRRIWRVRLWRAAGLRRIWRVRLWRTAGLRRICIGLVFCLAHGVLAGEKELAEWTKQVAERFRKADEPYACWRGPFGSGAGIDTGTEMVPCAANARQVWMSDVEVPGAYGKWRSFRGSFPKPSWPDIIDGTVNGGFAMPVVAYRKVYLYYYLPSGDEYLHEGPRRRRLLEADDVMHCFDADTGKTVWRRSFPLASINHNQNEVWKNGGHFTPCVADGRVYFYGPTLRLYCLDANTGQPLWQSDFGRRHEMSLQGRDWWKTDPNNLPPNGGWCIGYCPAYADGVVAISDGLEYQGGPRNIGGAHLTGYDAKTGRPLWKVQGAAATLGSAVRWIHCPSGARRASAASASGQGGEYFIAPGGDMHCIEPRTGKVCWKIPGDQAHAATPTVAGDYLIAGWRGAGHKKQRKQGICCWKMTPEKAILHWKTEDGFDLGGHIVPVIYGDHVYAGRRGMACFNLHTGKLLGRTSARGWGSGVGSLVALNGYLWVEGGAGNPQEIGSIDGVFAEPELFGKSGPTLEAGYLNSLTCAVAYDRVYFRNRWRLMCFDLRKSASALDAATAQKCVEFLFGKNERSAKQAATALRNVKPEAQQIAANAFKRCLEDGREHLLGLGIRAALISRSPRPEVVTAALDTAARKGNTKQFLAVLGAVPEGHRLRSKIFGDALSAALAGKPGPMVDGCLAYVVSADVAKMDKAAREPVRKALLALLDRPGGLTKKDLIAALLTFAPEPAELESRWLAALGKEKGNSAAARILGVVPGDSEYVRAAKFLPHALHCVKSKQAKPVIAGTGFARRYGLTKLTAAQKKEWIGALIALLKSESKGARNEAVVLLGEFGSAAKAAIPVLRIVYLEQGMRASAEAAIKAIDPRAKVVELATEEEPDLDLDL